MLSLIHIYHELAPGNMLFNFRTWPESGSEKWPPKMDYPAGARVYDAYHPQARDIYWKYLNENLRSVGRVQPPAVYTHRT